MNRKYPDDWSPIPLKQCGKWYSGGTPAKDNPAYWGGEIPWISAKSMYDIFVSDSEEKVTELGAKNGTRVVPKGTLLILVRGSMLYKKIPLCLTTRDVAFNQDVKAIITNPQVSASFLLYYLMAHENILLSTIETTGMGAGKLSTDILENFDIYLPPLEEQRKIAAILGAWDEAIGIVEGLIEALQRRKRGLMQVLLTGAVRFPGFEGEWEEVRLGEVGSTYTGLSGKTKEDFGSGKPYIPYKNIFDNSAIDPEWLEEVTINDGENQNRVKYGDVFFTTSSETSNEVGMTSVLLDDLGECYLNSFCFGYRLNNLNIVNPSFLRYLLRSEMFRRDMYKLAQGSTRYNISKNEVMKIGIQLPDPSEQKQIASCIDQIETMISDLATYRNTLREQKKGLMQGLLTGVVRVTP